jgi:hypothetical protein
MPEPLVQPWQLLKDLPAESKVNNFAINPISPGTMTDTYIPTVPTEATMVTTAGTTAITTVVITVVTTIEGDMIIAEGETTEDETTVATTDKGITTTVRNVMTIMITDKEEVAATAKIVMTNTQVENATVNHQDLELNSVFHVKNQDT